MSSLQSRQHNHGGGMTMSGPVRIPSYVHMQKVFWAFVGTAIGVAIIANAINMILYHQRMSARRSTPDAARPKSLFFKAHAAISAVIRESSSYSMPLSFGKRHFYLPPAGPVMMIVGYFALIAVCCFYRFDTTNLLQWEQIGYRSGFVGVAQMPLIVLLAGKRNVVGFFTGMGYERLAWLHRWVARSLLLTILIHVGYWFTTWNKFHYAGTKIREDVLTQRGIAAGAVLLWIVVSSAAPIRKLSYEVFVVQHIISWLGFFVALYFHIPAENKIWIWLPLGFWAFDRTVRAGYLLYNNLSIFHKSSTGILACSATFEPLGRSHTRITIANPPIAWKAGQHIVLSCHPLAPLTSHPFTIASLPEDGKMEFIVHAKGGATKRFFRYAERTHPTLPSSSVPGLGRSVLIEGPYSKIRPLRQFDSLVFVAGSTGATFTLPLMRDIVQQWTGKAARSSRSFGFESAPGAVTRHIRFVWVVKRRAVIDWFAAQLDQVVTDVETLRNEGHDVAVEISIYITCDDVLTSGQSSIKGDNYITSEGESTTPSRSSSTSGKKDVVSNVEKVSSSSSSSEKGGCCCTRVITDEDAINPPCNCASRRHQQQLSSSLSPPTICSSEVLEKSQTFVDVRIAQLSGRPHVTNIIRKTAELALGEMAVVVCGPPGLVQCTRNAVVAISDDRAVHKGTGAQGIYCHAETFGYA